MMKTMIENGSLTKIGLHAIMGGLAAGANEALIDTLANQYDNMSQDQRSGLLVMNSQVLVVFPMYQPSCAPV